MSRFRRTGPSWQQFIRRWRSKPRALQSNSTIYRLNFQPLELRDSAGFTWFQAALPAIGAGAAFLAWSAAEQYCEASEQSAPSATIAANSSDDFLISMPTTSCETPIEASDEQSILGDQMTAQFDRESSVVDSTDELPSDVAHGVDVSQASGGSLGQIEMPINHLSDSAPLEGFVGESVDPSQSAGGRSEQSSSAPSDGRASPMNSSSPSTGNQANSVMPASDASTAAMKSAAEAKFATAPVAFEQNVGQANSEVKYLVHGSGYELFLTDSQAVFSVQETANSAAAGPATNMPTGASGANPAPLFDIVRMGFVGANATTPQASGQTEEVTNYDIGRDPTQWRTGIANFSSVEYPNIYPGIDLVFQPDSQNPSQPEFHFVLHPGANPEQIHLSFQGASNIALDSAGDLVITTQGSKLVEQAPTTYQSNASGARTTVPGSFVVESDGTVGFSIGAYDASRSLVIDPTIEMARNIGDSSNSDVETGVAIYSNGDAAISGYTSGSDFPVAYAAQDTLEGDEDATFVKLDSSGNILIATYLGGATPDADTTPPESVQAGTAIAIGPDNTAYMVGTTDTSDFPITEDAYESSLYVDSVLYSPVTSSFLTVFDSSGGISYSSYAYAHNDGSLSMWTNPNNDGLYASYSWQVQEDVPTGIAVDSDGTAYVSGWTSGTIEASPFPPPPSTPPGDPQHVADAFAYAMNTDGTMKWSIWQTYDGTLINSGFPGNGNAAAYGVALSPDQSSVYLVGWSSSTSGFPVTSGAFQTTMDGASYGYNGFVLQLDTSTGDVDTGTFLGGSIQDRINAVAVDSDGNVYVTGQTQSTDFPTQSPIQSELNNGDPTGDPDTFITKFDSSLSSVSYSTYFGGDGWDWGDGIAVDSDQNVTIIGGGGFSDTVDTIASTGAVFMAQVSADGSTVNYATPLGEGTGPGGGVAVDSSGNAWGVGGSYDGLPSGEITYTGSNPGSGFVIVLGTS